MANRYGRNQKRRHREQIAALQEASQMDRALLDRVSKRAADLDAEMTAWDEEIRRLLGTHSALRRRTPEMQSSRPIREMPIMQRITSYDAMGSDVLEMPANTRERMRRFVFTLERDDMRMQKLIRFMETDGRGGVAYAISETALAQGFGRREIAYLAHEIAAKMVGHFNSERTSH